MATELDLIKFQYYNGNIKDTEPRGFVTLKQFIITHKHVSTKMLKVFDEIELATVLKDKQLKSKLKTEHLFYFTPGAIFDKGRKYSNIKKFTGLAQIDIDGLEPEEALDLKEWLFDNYKHVYCVYTSPSKSGVKALMRIPIVKSVEEYKEYYQGIQDEFEWISGFDSAPKNLALPLFLSYDYDILYRESAEVWHKKGVVQNIDDKQNMAITAPERIIDGDETVYKSGAYYKKITLDIFEKRINDIVDNGHPTLRSASLVLGSRIGAGYVSRSEAETFAEQCIKNNSYLSKGINGYISTMKWCIKQSINNPKYYD